MLSTWQDSALAHSALLNPWMINWMQICIQTVQSCSGPVSTDRSNGAVLVQSCLSATRNFKLGEHAIVTKRLARIQSKSRWIWCIQVGAGCASSAAFVQRDSVPLPCVLVFSDFLPLSIQRVEHCLQHHLMQGNDALCNSLLHCK